MTTYFSADLLPTPGQEPAQRRAMRRLLRKAMRQAGRTLISRSEYTIGDPLRIPRATAFQAVHKGKAVKLGIRAGADRWIAITETALAKGGELAEVDYLFVVTFKDPQKRDTLQLWQFDAALVADMGKKVFVASGKGGQQWLPLDDTQDAGVHSMVAGSLAQHGVLLVEDAVEWADVPSPSLPVPDGNRVRLSPDGAGTPPKLTIAEAKAGLAAHFGVSPDSIKINIEG